MAKVLKASWRRWRAHFLRNDPAHTKKSQQQNVIALINTTRAQETADPAHGLADCDRSAAREIAVADRPMIDTADHEVLTFIDFPKEHWVKIHSTNVLERLNDEQAPCRRCPHLPERKCDRASVGSAADGIDQCVRDPEAPHESRIAGGDARESAVSLPAVAAPA